MEYPLGQLSQLCPLSGSCAPPAHSLGSRIRNRDDSDTIQQQLKYPSVIRSKILSILARPTTFSTSANWSVSIVEPVFLACEVCVISKGMV